MILVDPKDGPKPNTTSVELKRTITQLGVPCEIQHLEYGDAYCEGYGPKGRIDIGIERKTLADMLNCVEDARYNKQRVGMMQRYAKSFLIVEGLFTASGPPGPTGLLYEGYRGGQSWGPFRRTGQSVMYSKLYRYLLSVAHTGVIITYSRDLYQTAFNICEIYQYHQKRWEDHTSMITPQRLAIATMDGKPTLTRLWANDLDDIGVKYSLEAEKVFKSPLALAQSSEQDWLKIKGIGVKTAQRIIRQIWGVR